MKIDRLLSIVIMLLNRERVQAKDLAEHFGVSVRTIYRDIDAINEAGIPIVTYQGNNGGLGIVDTYKIDRQVLTLNDMVSILSVLKGVNSSFQDNQLHNAIEKIHALVPGDKQEYLARHMDHLVVDVMPWGMNDAQKEKIISLQQVIAGSRLIRFIYHDTNGSRSQRAVEAMTLVYKAAAWYLFGFCRLRNDYRLFRLSRIKGLELLDEPFVRKDVGYREYEKTHSSNVKMIKLVVRFSKAIRHNVEDYFEDSSLLHLDNGDIVATFEIPDNDWVLSYLLSFGDNAEVIEPKKMRDLLQEKAKKLIALYQT